MTEQALNEWLQEWADDLPVEQVMHAKEPCLGNICYKFSYHK